MAAVDVEDESILASIFKDSFPDSWRDVPDFTAYLSELSGFGVDQLGREPERLAEERAQILQQTRELAFSNYQTFIRTADCTEHIYRDFGRVESSVSRLLDKLPGFGERCRGFMKEAEEIAVSRRMNSLTLNRHTEILEILEIPQLMDTCVRNGYYEEALELAAYVKRLEKKHSALPVIQGIVREVRQSTQLMLNQLLQQLRSNSQLPVCLRVIGYLRRMDVFTEAELRVKFLQARGTWLSSILNAIPEDDPYFHVTKTIEACRVHLFDIITQYRAIFSDEDPLVPPAGGQVAVNEAAIFHGWVVQKVAEFLETLERDLQRGVGGRLDSLLGQCMYFGLSFSRVGADFRGQLAPMFQQVAAETFRGAVQEAVDKFQEDMNLYTLIALPSVLGGTIPPVAPSTQPGTLQPPMALLDFQPLACFLNNILTAFNDLRLCCPVGLAQDVTRCLEDGLKKVTRQILVFHRAEESAFSDREKELFVQFCCSYADDLLPFLNRCLQVLFPPAQLALILGVPPTQLHRYGSLGCIELPAVLEPLDFLLPQRETLAPPPSMPELDLTAELSSGTFQTQPKEPATDPDLTVETGSPDPALTWSGLRERESEPTEPKSEELDEEFSLE
ncbi:conserved oligomeric Golgi complex subunit 8 [Larimichthys crocea]|uniref:conserved oligomeric Golgi complex subunit 8 n=1 Tax=Larimichthys crocea TaxID=215358 RepID=UPI000F5EF413|nr:conserved oligomeric Golgi complex subunit 8 [Larimichthys crocea]XP_027137027.1 conserved oligomeric Golgi complex subunit 8 [Larimichthys crocea]XP_027137028.1 conserved oligomeric Golgi complex subunit 8 [Larimichthys crocea]XP_027137029.1 conserved oligomeric Golgi complex subunit 8 [Larimichthys crocea]